MTSDQINKTIFHEIEPDGCWHEWEELRKKTFSSTMEHQGWYCVKCGRQQLTVLKPTINYCEWSKDFGSFYDWLITPEQEELLVDFDEWLKVKFGTYDRWDITIPESLTRLFVEFIEEK